MSQKLKKEKRRLKEEANALAKLSQLRRAQGGSVPASAGSLIPSTGQSIYPQPDRSASARGSETGNNSKRKKDYIDPNLSSDDSDDESVLPDLNAMSLNAGLSGISSPDSQNFVSSVRDSSRMLAGSPQHNLSAAGGVSFGNMSGFATEEDDLPSPYSRGSVTTLGAGALAGEPAPTCQEVDKAKKFFNFEFKTTWCPIMDKPHNWNFCQHAHR